MEQGTQAVYKDLYGEHWEEGRRYEEERMERARAEARVKVEAVRERERKRRAGRKVEMVKGVYMDDWDARY